MLHHKLVDKFKSIFPRIGDDVVEWFCNGKDSIRVRLKNNSELIFIYHSDRRWTLETKNNYLDRMEARYMKK